MDLTVAGPAPRDRLVTGRVLLLGGAAAVAPMAPGIRSVLGSSGAG